MNVDYSEGDTNVSSHRSGWHEAESAAIKELLREDAEYFIHQPLSTPCLTAIESACGNYLIDLDGKYYLDLHGNSAHQVGYRHPHVVDAVKRQLDELPFSPRRFANAPAVRLAKRLSEASSIPDAKVLFAPGGATCIGISLKIARIATGRFKTISMWGSFHGGSLESISLGGAQHFRKGMGPLMPGAEHVPPYDPIRCPLKCGNACHLGCAEYVKYILESEGDIAAIVVEPIRATTVILPPKEYWKTIREACDRTGTLLIFDEIPTCLGRTGAFFAGEHTGVVPDLCVIGKGLGGGMIPMAAVLAKGSLCENLGTSLGHYTHEKSPLGSAAGNAVLDVLESERLIDGAVDKGALFLAGLNRLVEKHASVLQARGYGLQLALELSSPEIAETALYHCLRMGLNLKQSVGTVLTLTPPLTITRDEIGSALAILDEALKASV